MSAEPSPKRAAPRRAAVLLLCLAATLLMVPAPAADAGEGWWGALDEGEAVSLADIMRSPSDFRGRTLTFFAIFHRKENYFDPVRTPFTPKRYDNFSAWPDGTAVWEEQAYSSSLPFLYIPRAHEQRDDLMRSPMFTRIELTGRIRDLLRGRPTIEIFSFRPTGHRLGRKVVKDVMRANSQARAGTQMGYQMAARNLKGALQPDLPPLYEMQIRKLLGQCLRKMGHEAEAAAFERGETYGGASLAEADPSARRPSGVDRHGRPIAQPAAGGDLRPGTSPWEGGAPGTPPAGMGRSADMGSPDGPGEYPGGFSDTQPAQPAPAPASRSPLAGADDLPGAPAAPISTADDLPGNPGQAPPPPTWDQPTVRRPRVPAPGQPTPGGAGALPPPRRSNGTVQAPGTGDLPGTPSYPQPSGASSRRTTASGSGARAATQPRSGNNTARPRTPPVRTGPVSGIPPKRTPRLSGVR